MVRTETGMLVRSLAGHEKDRLYIIIRQDEEYVWLVDGRNRTMEKPKKKKKKHTTTHPQVVYRPERNGTVAPAVIVTDTRETTTKRTKPVGAIGEVIHSDDGDYWATNKCATLDPDEYGGRISALIFIDQHGKEFIFPEENSQTRQYL